MKISIKVTQEKTVIDGVEREYTRVKTEAPITKGQAYPRQRQGRIYDKPEEAAEFLTGFLREQLT